LSTLRGEQLGFDGASRAAGVRSFHPAYNLVNYFVSSITPYVPIVEVAESSSSQQPGSLYVAMRLLFGARWQILPLSHSLSLVQHVPSIVWFASGLQLPPLGDAVLLICHIRFSQPSRRSPYRAASLASLCPSMTALVSHLHRPNDCTDLALVGVRVWPEVSPSTGRVDLL